MREQGVNGHIEMAAAFERAGFDCIDVHMTNMPPEAMGGCNDGHMTNMPPEAMEGMSPDMMANMPPEAMAGMSPDNVSYKQQKLQTINTH